MTKNRRGGTTGKSLAAVVGMMLALTLVALPAQWVRAQEAVEARELPVLQVPEREVTGTVSETSPQTLPKADAPMLAQSAAEVTQPMPEVGTANSDNPIDLIETPKPLRVGLIAERGVSYLQARIEPFRRYLQESMTQPVEIVAFRSMQALIAAHTSQQIDYAHYPASTFAMAHASCGCLLPLVAPVSSRAPDGIYMLLVVRGESGIRSLAEMTGRSLALSSKTGALPFHVALNELRQEGLNPDRDLATLYSRDTPQEALSMLEKGEVDAALVWSTTQFNQSLFSSQGAIAAYQEAKKTRRNKQPAQPDFLSIWRSRAVPAGPYAVHNQMPKQQRAELIKAMTGIKQDDPDAYDAIERFYDAGFQTVTLDSYAPLIEVATAR